MKYNNKKNTLIGGSTCNTVPNLSVYDGYSGFEGLRCDGLPLDSAFSNYNMSGGGFFFDVGNLIQFKMGCLLCKVIQNVVHLYLTPDLKQVLMEFLMNQDILHTNGNPICGGGRKSGNNRSRKRQSKKNSQSVYSRKGRNKILKTIAFISRT